jgi:hypothetical protein
MCACVLVRLLLDRKEAEKVIEHEKGGSCIASTIALRTTRWNTRDSDQKSGDEWNLNDLLVALMVCANSWWCHHRCTQHACRYGTTLPHGGARLLVRCWCDSPTAVRVAEATLYRAGEALSVAHPPSFQKGIGWVRE